MIKAVNIKKSFGENHILNGVNLEIKKGELVAIIGASGAGKTSLLQILGTLDKPNDGEIYINDKAIHSMKDKEISKFRNSDIGFVFQFHHLLPEFTALENVLMPGLILGGKTSEVKAKAVDLLKKLKVDHRAEHKPSEMSGGEQQRVAVARALINAPSVILADEPSGNLDSNNASDLHDLFVDLKKEFNQTFVIVTHNRELANLADRVIEIADGNIVAHE
ncbi:MAG: lipoprotein-releasing system ATP-binding protein LolD [Flavobacteriales bacterium]|nr:lipoprotein-releasing system ATP-binding protein LolD [Flavobacteriales bacterium]|tara:strand:+ start:674 stop:1333 length:660 start_codon:yes stop_codon:yes gene_type:complete